MTQEIPEHESAVRRLYNESHGLEYHPLHTLEEAQATPNGVVVMEGDYGGQIYLTCPAALVACGKPALDQLLADLDRLAWECNDGEGASIYFERAKVGAGVVGGCGGGVVAAGLWVHDDFVEVGLDQAIADVVYGRVERLAVPSRNEYLRAAESGDVKAQFWVGNDIYSREFEKSRGDYTDALKWLRLAAEQNHEGAINLLETLIPDGPEKVKWLYRLADSPSPSLRAYSAQLSLAHIFDRGSGVRADRQEAAKWFERVSENLYYAESAVRLGKMCYSGDGLPRDLVEALKWLTLGAVQDVRLPPHWFTVLDEQKFALAQKLIARLKQEMSEEEVNEAMLRAAAWTVAHTSRP